jgi:hypothetical protein
MLASYTFTALIYCSQYNVVIQTFTHDNNPIMTHLIYSMYWISNRDKVEKRIKYNISLASALNNK